MSPAFFNALKILQITTEFMKGVQISRYSKNINTVLRDIPLPQIFDSEVLIQVKAAAINPLNLLILTGSIKLIQNYTMPLTFVHECSVL